MIRVRLGQKKIISSSEVDSFDEAASLPWGEDVRGRLRGGAIGECASDLTDLMACGDWFVGELLIMTRA